MTVILDQTVQLPYEEAHSRIQALALGCAEHPAVKNPFYDLWISQELTADQVELVAKNFYERVRRTPIRIALAFLHMTDITARAETVENLYDEMGHGNPAKAHSVILKEFLEGLLSRLRGRPVDLDTVAAPVLPSTLRLIEQSEKVFSSSLPQEVCGALLAQEWHAYPQLVNLYEGVRNYRGLYGFEEFHENCEFFYLHIGATEKQHKVHALSTAAKACASVEDIEQLERGFSTYLDLLAENWAEVYQVLKAG
ncbi:iron-containing redox enzyme family protein [Kitasatospora sp. NBC_01287]|uniref:iron-containing redox enzyme family protein n=1 Tax=Kitasatospora sp. NBC_01287 TaxID=2903573 RepID=UPI0022568102|nr:iron-containing redox enzyme family protein [Kitasatospora sp. NBC_01287]MCX4745043.1 iron-containing redox enzyme family protein [Kitasatospora sp. NBC_01287]